MTPYFVLFGFFAFFAVADPSTYRRITPPVFMILWAVLTVFIGLRHEVGSDWLGYNNIYFNIAGRDPLDAILQTEAGYGFLNWVSYSLKLQIYGVNLFCGGAIAYALLKFCNRQSNFFVAFSVATPILLILIGMSLTRQATALAFMLLGFMAIEDKRLSLGTILCILAVSFHTSVMIAIAVFFAGNSKNRIALGLFGAGLLFIGYILVGEARLEIYQDRYLDTARASEGALIRILLGCVAAGLYLLYRKRFTIPEGPMRSYFLSSSLLLFLFAILTPITGLTIVFDRMAMYFYPLQAFVFGSIEPALNFGPVLRFLFRLAVLMVYLAVLYVFLVYGQNSVDLLPYRNLIFL